MNGRVSTFVKVSAEYTNTLNGGCRGFWLKILPTFL